MSSPPAMEARGPLDWRARATAKWLAGLIMGLLVALLVAAMMALFPALETYSVDAGIRLKSAVRLPALTEVERQAGVRGYVFLDIDGGGGAGLVHDERLDGQTRSMYQGLSASEASCQSLALRPSNSGAKYRLETGAAAAGSIKALPDRQALECAELRSPNRFLLAELVEELSRRGAKLIILDVLLTNDRYPFATQESDALRRVIEDQRDRVLIAAPIYPEGDAEAGRPPIFGWLPPGAIVQEPLLHRIAGSPFTSVEPVRSFAICAKVRGETGALSDVPALPVLAAARLANRGNIGSICTMKHADSALRIDFTLMSQRSHLDEVSVSGLDSRELATARVATRCLAEYFWHPDAVCGQPDQFAGKVVIVGASSLARRDRFQTPIGAMSGAELVLNGIRTALARPAPVKTGLWDRAQDELFLGSICSLLWLAAWMLLGWWDSRPPLRSRLREWARRSLTVFGAFASVCLLTFLWSFRPGADEPRLDILIPLLAIGIEPLAAGITKTAEILETGFEELFGRWKRKN